MTESVRLEDTGVGQVLVSAFLGGVDVPAPRTNGSRHQGYMTLFSLGWHLIQDKVPKTHFVIVLNVNTDIINGMTRTKDDSLLSVTYRSHDKENVKEGRANFCRSSKGDGTLCLVDINCCPEGCQWEITGRRQ